MGVKLDYITHLENMFLDFLCRSGSVCLISLKKVLILPQKYFLLKNSYRVGIKNAEFYADFKSVKFNAKKCTPKQL